MNGPSAAANASSKETMRIKFRRAELCVVDEFRNGIDNGWTFRTEGGAIVDLYDDGRLVVQGKNAKIVLAKLRRLQDV